MVLCLPHVPPDGIYNTEVRVYSGCLNENERAQLMRRILTLKVKAFTGSFDDLRLIQLRSFGFAYFSHR